jgi:hypothetical protein
MTDQKIARRSLLKSAITGLAAIPVIAMVRDAHAAGTPMLDDNDPSAKALHYVADGTKVDAKANPTYKAGANCANCMNYKAAGATAGSCTIFPGKQVAAAGWCAAYAKKA